MHLDTVPREPSRESRVPGFELGCRIARTFQGIRARRLERFHDRCNVRPPRRRSRVSLLRQPLQVYVQVARRSGGARDSPHAAFVLS
jgi:hypothetical protein